METAGTTSHTSERGIGFQALGFAVVGCASVAILQLWSESGSWAYQSFETAVSRLYWAFVVPLAAVFDWGRRMFETREEIRKAAVEKALRKGIKKALRNERQRIRERIATYSSLFAPGVNVKEIEKKLLETDPA